MVTTADIFPTTVKLTDMRSSDRGAIQLISFELQASEIFNVEICELHSSI